MNQRCPNAIICDGVDSPLVNLSSEGPESQYWRAIDYCCNGAIKQYFSNISFDDALDGVQRLLVTSCPTCPPTVPDGTDEFYSCDALCADGSATVTGYSTLSQEDACFKAQELAAQVPCPPVTPPTYFCNDTQICESINEDGTYTYIILPCTIYGESPAAANAIALSRACERAKENRIKLGPITRCCCANEAYSSSIKVTSDEASLTYAVISGTVPPGITVGTGTTTSKTILVSGTPTTAGTYTFSLRAYDTSGNYSTRQYTISVIEITTTSLPDFTVGTAYSAQLSATGGSGVYAWGIASGTLPDGLSLSTTGLISGTPTATAAAGDVIFTVADTECEQLEAATIPPRLTISSISTTRFVTKHGWNEYAPGGTGQLYKRVDYTGEVIQKAFPQYNDDESINQTQCGGAKFVFGSYDQIDNYGNIVSRHTKNLYTMCWKGTPLIYDVVLLGNTNQAYLSVHSNPSTLLGYCWSSDPNSCPSCDTDDDEWDFIYDAASFGSIDYPTGLIYSGVNPTVTPTSRVYDGSSYHSSDLCLTPGTPNFPTNNGGGNFVEALPWIRLESTSQWSATLSEPFTDADANNAAQIYYGTSRTAENHPNYLTWLYGSLVHQQSRYTTSSYTINCANLVLGREYSVKLTFANSAGYYSTSTITFTATASTHTITGNVPTPLAGYTNTLKTAVISMN